MLSHRREIARKKKERSNEIIVFRKGDSPFAYSFAVVFCLKYTLHIKWIIFVKSFFYSSSALNTEL